MFLLKIGWRKLDQQHSLISDWEIKEDSCPTFLWSLEILWEQNENDPILMNIYSTQTASSMSFIISMRQIYGE